MATVLALGLDPAAVDPAEFGGFTPQQVRAFIESQLERVRTAGYDVVNCLVTADTAVTLTEQALKARHFDCVMIGAGLRAPAQLILFEKLLNLVHALAPDSKLCFNSNPTDTIDAVRRWA